MRSLTRTRGAHPRRYENLADDLPEAVRLINERRDKSLPPIPEPKIYWKKKGQVGGRIKKRHGRLLSRLRRSGGGYGTLAVRVLDPLHLEHDHDLDVQQI